MVGYDKRPNSEIRKQIREMNIPQHEVAHRCGIDEGTLCRWLRYELPADDERRQRIIEAIQKGR